MSGQPSYPSGPAPAYGDASYGKSQYPQQGYPGQPAQPVYGMPQTSVVVVQQAPQPVAEYTMPKARAPSIIMIIFAVINCVAMITFAVLHPFSVEYVLAFLLYLTTGILGLVGAVKVQHTNGIAIGVLVMSICCIIFSFVQIILRGLGVLAGALIMDNSGNDHYVHILGQVVLGLSVALLIIAVVAFCLAIALTVFSSKVLCTCCGAQDPANRGTVYQQNPAFQGQQT